MHTEPFRCLVFFEVVARLLYRVGQVGDLARRPSPELLRFLVGALPMSRVTLQVFGEARLAEFVAAGAGDVPLAFLTLPAIGERHGGGLDAALELGERRRVPVGRGERRGFQLSGVGGRVFDQALSPSFNLQPQPLSYWAVNVSGSQQAGIAKPHLTNRHRIIPSGALQPAPRSGT